MDTDGGPQADGGGEQGLIIRTSFILSGAHQATQVSDERLMINDCLHTDNTDDADVRRRTVWGNVNHRTLNGI